MKFKEILWYIMGRRKNIYNLHLLKKKDVELPRNIFGDKYLHDNVKTWHKVHYSFKYRLLEPIIWLSEKLLGDKLTKPIPDEEQFKEMLLMEKAFYLTIDKWCDTVGRIHLKWDDTQIRKEKIDGRAIKLFVKSFQILMFLARYESIVKTFLEMFMHNIAITYQNEFKGQTLKHVLYTDKDAFNVQYFALIDKLKKEGENENSK